MYSAAELRARGKECYAWIEICTVLWCFTRWMQPYHHTFELNSCQYLCIYSATELYISVVQCWIFDMCDKGFFALGAFWPKAVVHYPTECVLPTWALSSKSCTMQVRLHRADHTEKIQAPTVLLCIYSSISGIFMYSVHIVTGGQAQAPTYWKIWRRG